MLRPRIRIPRAGGLLRRSVPTSRFIHKVPHLKQFNALQHVPKLLSPGGYDLAWTQYMHHLVEKLNALTAGTEFYEKDVVQVIRETARQPSQAAIFNYASMTHNNALFFQGLAESDDTTTDNGEEMLSLGESRRRANERVPEPLRSKLETTFSSIETLRREFMATALGMFGPGFVWLVKYERSTELRILTTYLAGTPYTAAHWRRQPVDMNTEGGDLESTGQIKGYQDRRQTAVGGYGGGKYELPTVPGGVDVTPLLCLNTWEHVWLQDYGFGTLDHGGKRAYVDNWWGVIDWDLVLSRGGYGRQNKFKTISAKEGL